MVQINPKRRWFWLMVFAMPIGAHAQTLLTDEEIALALSLPSKIETVALSDDAPDSTQLLQAWSQATETTPQQTHTQALSFRTSVFARAKARLGLGAPTLRVRFFHKDGAPIKADSALLKNVQVALSGLSADDLTDLISANARVLERAKSAAEAMGYYDAKFAVQFVPQGIDVRVLEVGDAVQVQDLTYQAPPDFAPTNLQVGAPFRHGEFDKAIADIDKQALELGYFDGRWLDRAAEIVLPDNTADVSVAFDGKERYQFGDIVLLSIKDGKVSDDPRHLPIKPELLQKLLTMDTNTPYDGKKVRALQNDLLATNYFNVASVEQVLPFDNQDNQDDASASTLPRPVDTPIQNRQADTRTSQADDLQTLIAQKAYALLQDAPDAPLDPSNKSWLAQLAETISYVFERKQDKPVPIEDTIARISPASVRERKKVPIYVLVSADKPKDMRVGIGYGSDTGTHATLRFDHNLVDKNGTKASVALAVAKDQRRIGVDVTHPLSHPLHDKLLTQFLLTDGRTSATSPKHTTLSAQIGRHWTSEQTQLGTHARYVYERGLVPFAGQKRAPRQAWLVGMDAAWTHARHKFTLAGMAGYGSASCEGCGNGAFFGIDGKGAWSKDNWLVRYQLGVLAQNRVRVPWDLYLKAGGAQSIRGFDKDSIYQDAPMMTRTVASVEYARPIWGDIKLAGFVDAGGVYQGKDFNVKDTHVGVGVGLRYATPIGTLQFDVAKAVLGMPSDDKNKVRLHFFIGAPF